MGTRADFYVGRGENAEWLGSIAYDGYALDEMAQEKPPGTSAATEVEWRAVVSSILRNRGDATLPEQGWPWPWDTSATSDYAYAYDDGAVWVCSGRTWRKLGEKRGEDDDDDRGPAAVFPNMVARRNLTLGPRSGLLVFCARE